MSIIKGKGQRLIPEELLKYLEALKNKYPDAVDLVEANPTLEGGEDSLSSVLINGTKFAVGGGSEVHLYGHYISAKQNANSNINLVIYNNDNTAFTSATLKSWLNTNGFSVTSNNSYVASGYYTTGEVVIGLGVSGSSIEISTEFINSSNVLAHDIKNFTSFSSLTDTIIQIF